MQLTVDNIQKWLKTRKLDLNQKKFQVLTINKNKPFPTNLLINKTKTPAVKYFKDLGIYTSGNLKWNEHVNYLNKIAKSSSFQKLKSFFKTSSASILTKLFIIYVRPKLTNNTPIWSP